MSKIHDTKHPLAGKTVELKEHAADPLQKAVVGGAHYRIEDWWDVLTDGSWMFAEGNPAAMHYGWRSGLTSLPIDNEVVYGKIGNLGHLVHISELGEVQA